MNMTLPHASAACLSEDDLFTFRSGRSTDVAFETRVAEHLGACDVCEARLEALSRSRQSDQVDQLIVALLRAPDPLASFTTVALPNISGGLTSDFELIVRHEELLARLEQSSLPAKIGKYFVLDWIARGGFGDVYKAKDPEQDRIVAIKVPRLNSAEQAVRFVKEARTAGQLVHPAIVQVYDCQVQDDGTCLVVMQYIDGRSLRDVLSSERVPYHASASWAARIADALQYAHSQNIYHRDVKPENILIDKQGRPYLADFGLAVREENRWDHAGEEAGTSAYMSPEQVRRETQYIDGRSDIWSLGVVFYELLTRHKPFTGRTRQVVFDEIQHREPRPPRAFDPRIPVAYERACLRCLEKRPSNRFPTAAQLARTLRLAQHAKWKRLGIAAAVVILLAMLAAAAMLDSHYRAQLDDSQRVALVPRPAPYDLLDREPRPLVLPSRTDQSITPITANLNKVLQTFAVQAPTYCLYSFGRSPDSRYLIRTSLQKSAPDGAAGLFFGFRKDETITEEDSWICHAILLTGFKRGIGDVVTRLERHRLRFTRLQNQFYLVRDLHESSVDIGPAGTGAGILEIRVHNQLVELIRWNGIEQKDLFLNIDDQTDPTWKCHGDFGIAVLYGSFVFSEARLVFD